MVIVVKLSELEETQIALGWQLSLSKKYIAYLLPSL